MEKVLNFKWSVSRGRGTYGYNICSLYVDGMKVESVDGGGYDMKGSVLARFIVSAFQPELMKIKRKASSTWNGKNYKHHKHGFYGMTYNSKEKRVRLDGACGFSCIEKVIEAIGLKLIYKGEEGKNNTLYILTDQPEAHARQKTPYEVNGDINKREIKYINKSMGYYFFSGSSMRFFNCKLETKGKAGKYNDVPGWFFVTSEQHDTEPRLYSARFMRNSGSIDTLGAFQGHKTRGEALQAIKELKTAI